MNKDTSSVIPNAESWSHIQETITMLFLAVCQIETSMADSNKSVDTLTQSFTDLVKHSATVNNHIQSVEKITDLSTFKAEIDTATTEMDSQVNKAITAFQFYDRISQRLDHVARSLESLTQLMRDNDQLNNPLAWKSIQNKVKSSYTMEAERLMFEHIMRGASVAEALEIYHHHFAREEQQSTDDEIELF